MLANDTDQDGDTLTVASLTQPAAGTATNNTTDISFTAPNDNGTANFTYQATDGSLNSNDATVTVSYVKDDLRGDCNSTGSVTAADFTATVLEIFDGGNDPQYGGAPAWWLIFDGGYAGSPIGCDSNASENGASNDTDSVTAADITCTVSVFFGDTSCTQPTRSKMTQTTATLSAPQEQAATAGSSVAINLTLDTGGNQVASVAFALALDPQVVSLDLTDADGDGLPDAVTIDAPPSMSRIVTWNAVSNRLEVAVFGVALPLPTLEDGVLATVTLDVAPNAPNGQSALTFEQASLGDVSGRDVALDVVNGSLVTGEGPGGTEGAFKVFLPTVIH